MKILAAGDLHGDVAAAKKLALRAEKENVDLVILTGDIVNADQKTDNLIGPFLAKHKKVIFVPGNHDSFATADFLAEIYPIRNLHGYTVRYDHIGFFGCGGANIGLEQLKESEMFDMLKQGNEKVSAMSGIKKKVMLTHVHPSHTKMETFSQFIPGSKGIKQAVDEFQPDILLCSHVHEAEGIEEKIGKTLVINVGKQGKIIDL